MSRGADEHNPAAAAMLPGQPPGDRTIVPPGSRIICLNATPADRSRIAALLNHLAARGFVEQEWPASDALQRASAAITIWSNDSIHDELVACRADQARSFAKHVPVLIDDTEPLVGFRQSQIIIVPEMSEALAETIEGSLLGFEAKAKPHSPTIERSFIDSVVLSILSTITVYGVFTAFSGSNPLSGTWINGFLIPSISAYLLLISIVRQPRLFFTRTRSGAGLLRLFMLDAAAQIIAYALTSTVIITSLMTDRRLLGGTGDFAWMLWAAIAAAYAAGLFARWAVTLLMTYKSAGAR